MIAAFRKKRKLSFLLVLFIFAQSYYAAKAQLSTTQFILVSLPRKANYDSKKLEKEIATAKSKAEVMKIIRSKNFSSVKIIIRINKQENHFSWWTIDTGSNESEETGDMELQSKLSLNEKIYKLSDFKEVLKDTVALIEPLKLILAFTDKEYRTSPYFARLSCTGNNSANVNLEVNEKNELIIPTSMLIGCNKNGTQLSLYNQANSNRMLGSSFFRVLDSNDKENLLHLGEFIATSDTTKTFKDVFLSVEDYTRQKYGRVPKDQLTELLQQLPEFKKER